MGDAGETRALRLAATATKWLEDVSVDREGHVHPAVATGGQALTALATAGARVSLAEPGRVVCSLRVRAPLTVRRCLACRRARRRRAASASWMLPVSPDLTWSFLARMQDAEGRWHAGAIAAAADNVCAAAVFTVLGADVVTVQYGLSYFSPAHHDVRSQHSAVANRTKSSIFYMSTYAA
jgi:acyl-coenzyme A thioesterase 13